ncbi:MAG TPA: hypothetical protein VD995_00085 [Azospirillum sp.]|nr:hypothetical protein [Azospirillum sp.]
MTRDDFPYSLQVYAKPADAGSDTEDWSLFLYRATDQAERAWLQDHGFILQGRVWVREAAVAVEPDPERADLELAD